MTFRHLVAGWALLALTAALGSCDSIPSRSTRHRFESKSSSRTSGVLTHLPYNLQSNVLRTRVRGLGADREIVNRAFAIFDLREFLTLIQNDATGGVEGSRGDSALLATLDRGDVVSGQGLSQLDSTQSGADLVAQEKTRDILKGGSASELDRVKQEGRVDSTSEHGKAIRVKRRARFANQAAFEDYLKNRAAFVRIHNAAIADIIEQDKVLRMIFQYSSKEFSELIQAETVSRDDLLQFQKTISVEEIVPGETFEYTLEARNTAPATLNNITLFDEFPVGLHFERTFRVTLTRADGSEESFNQETHPNFFQSAVTEDEWEHGKICWVVGTDFRHGDTLKLSFDATWYQNRGNPSGDAPRLYAEPVESADDIVIGLEALDRIFVIEQSDEDERFLHVFVQRVVESGDAKKVGQAPKLKRFEGFLLAEHYRREVESDAIDQELLFQEEEGQEEEGQEGDGQEGDGRSDEESDEE